MNKSNIVQFLECYERHPCLWNPAEIGYTKNNVRLAALKSIIQEMRLNVTIEKLKKKIKNIRTTYSREVTKIVESKRSGVGTDDVYKPRLIWFSTADRFLRPVIKGRSNKNTIINIDENSTEMANSDFSSFFDVLEPESDTEPVEKKMKFSSPKKYAQRTFQPDFETDDKSESSARNVRQDEFDVFGQYVASQLRSLPLTNAITCQNSIMNYLSKERIKVLSSQPSKTIMTAVFQYKKTANKERNSTL